MNEREILPILSILYEDVHCAAVEKPQGIPSEDGEGTTVPSLLRAVLTARGEAGEVYPVHRLDKPTGGAILYAKSQKAAAYLSAAVAHREIGKCYLAVVAGVPEPPAGEMRDYLYHDKRQNKVFAVKGGRKGAKEAVLEYRTLATVEGEDGPLTLVAVNLLTGRTHQIRAQFASRRLPVVGDRRYGSKKSLPAGRIALWSHRLVFSPAEGEGVREVTSRPPREYPWDRFGITDADGELRTAAETCPES